MATVNISWILPKNSTANKEIKRVPKSPLILLKQIKINKKHPLIIVTEDQIRVKIENTFINFFILITRNLKQILSI